MARSSFAATLALVPLLPLLATLTLAVPYSASSVWEERAEIEERGPYDATPLEFQAMGDMGISAQMMFLGTSNKVYVLDKTENNPVSITGKYGTHPAWATEWDINTNAYRTMDVFSNTFCAGGGVLANGTWVVFGGNQPVTTAGVAVGNAGAYSDTDGGTAIRMINPCDDQSCQWIQGGSAYTLATANTGTTGGYLQMTSRRWYPMVEALEDGSLIIIGGDKNGGYVNTVAQDNPTYEFFPPKGNGAAVDLQFLADALPVNLYALTWLMPSGLLFMQANRLSILYNYTSQVTTNLPDMPYATRVYPASAATVMLPLTPDNNFEVTILFCGGSNTTQWGNDASPGYNVTAVPADSTCVRISPDSPDPQYIDDDRMFEGRSMGQFVYLPDGSMWMGNGVAMGTAGYGDDHYSTGQSFGQAPLYMPAIYNSSAPPGARWNRTGLGASKNERMYHSTAILLPDSSILISGSNPNKDFTTQQWRSRTDADRWYPSYYNAVRPVLAGAPATLSYGGAGFNIVLSGTTDQAAVQSAKVVIIRGGFNTHAIGFGQRYLQLQNTFTIDMNTKNTTLHVAQMPGYPGPMLFQPGPALMFLVVNGVPSQGQMIMVGNGKVGTQPTAANAALPQSDIKALTANTTTSTTSGSGTSASAGASTSKSAAGPAVALGSFPVVAAALTAIFAAAGSVFVLA